MSEFDFAGAVEEFRRLTGTGALKMANHVLADLLEALVRRTTPRPTIQDARELARFQAQATQRTDIVGLLPAVALQEEHRPPDADGMVVRPFCEIVAETRAGRDAAVDDTTDEFEEAGQSPADGFHGVPRKRRPRSPNGVHQPRMTAAERALRDGQ
jgi:hypothetical protein